MMRDAPLRTQGPWGHYIFPPFHLLAESGNILEFPSEHRGLQLNLIENSLCNSPFFQLQQTTAQHTSQVHQIIHYCCNKSLNQIIT